MWLMCQNTENLIHKGEPKWQCVSVHRYKACNILNWMGTSVWLIGHICYQALLRIRANLTAQSSSQKPSTEQVNRQKPQQVFSANAIVGTHFHTEVISDAALSWKNVLYFNEPFCVMFMYAKWLKLITFYLKTSPKCIQLLLWGVVSVYNVCCLKTDM